MNCFESLIRMNQTKYVAGLELQEEREYLCIFGDVPYKDRETQIITCPKCHNKVSPEYVVGAVTAMRFIDKISENEIKQVCMFVFQ